MANPVHLEEFKKGLQHWNEWRKHQSEIPDLSEIDFTDVLISAKYLKEQNIIDLSEIDLSHCILVKSRFEKCIVKNANLFTADTSFCVFTESILESSNFKGVHGQGMNFHLAKGLHTRFDNADLTNSNFNSSNFSFASFQNANVENCLFVGTKLSEANFTGVDNSFFKWRTNFFGTPVIPKNYPTESIEATFGLHSYTKKMIADGIYLRSLWNRGDFWQKIFLRIWGITCGYGQSTLRWLICSLILIIFFALLLQNSSMSVSVYDPSKQQMLSTIEDISFIKALYYSVFTFVSLGYGDIVPISGFAHLLAVIEVCTGYAMLGGLISIFSNKLVRLS